MKYKIPPHNINLNFFFNHILKVDDFDIMEKLHSEEPQESNAKFTSEDIGLQEEIINWLSERNHRLFFEYSPYITSMGVFNLSPMIELDENDMIYFKLKWS